MFYRIVKRAFDFFVAFLSLVIFSPVFLIVAIAITINSKGPVIFKQQRMGMNKEPINIYKFRTMKVDAPKDCATRNLENPDEYITTVGRFLRKTSLDEVPQLVNVLIGNMSLIGPRPVVLTETVLIEERYKQGIYQIKPGVSGWAQINGRDHVSVAEKVKYDKAYLDNMSISMDLKILFKTVGYVFRRKGIHEGDTSTINNVEPKKDDHDLN